jgi:serine/threonine-protein kinase
MAAIAADRNLLFGLIALQNGLINQVQLLAAFQAWTLDRSRNLADHLTARRDLDDEDRVAVEALAARHIKKHGGDLEQSLAAINAGRSTRESLARLADADLEASLAHLGSQSTHTGEDPDLTTTFSVGTTTSEGQRFRVLRPHARGGLGAVFVALDEELHREVALKQILDQHADDPISRSRFLLEAEITGRLEHPGIVPVYGLGRYSDGRPYYAMRFVRGDSFKEVIEHFHADMALTKDAGRRSLELHKLLRRFLGVCNAIDYAHSRGVLHRDIKPGNIIVGKHGETLVVDWGLAKATGKADPVPEERPLLPSSASSSAETLPGSALGTPSYMSPEQAAGELDRLGTRSDIYSLGATLYCLLTGKPPFDGDAIEVIPLVQKGEIVPPSQLDPAIDRPLEAICLRAMARNPAERYATPQALAEDLERWMADEPVTACRETLSRRVRRWSRHNRTVVTAATVLLVTAVGGLTIGTVLLGRAKSEIQNQRDLARTNLQKAQQAVDEYFTQVSENTLLKSPLPGLQPLRHELLKTALRYYQDFTREAEAGPASRAELARAFFRMGRITAVVGSKDDALQQFTRAAAIWEGLLRERPGDAEYREELAKDLVSMATIQNRDLGKAQEALRNLQQTQAFYEGLARVSPGNEAYQAGLAGTFQELGHWYYLHQRGEAEAREGLKAYDIYKRLSVAIPRYRLDAAAMAMNLGFWNTRQLRTEEALRYHREARTILESMNREQPGDVSLQGELGRIHLNVGYTYHISGRYDEALSSYESATEIRDRLARENPRVIDYQAQLAQAYKQQAYLLRRMKRYSRAVDCCRRAIGIAEAALAKLAPDSFELRWTLAESFMVLGENCIEIGHFDEAIDVFSRAVDRFRDLHRDHRDNTDIQYALGRTRRSYGFLMAATGKKAEAIGSYQSAIDVLEPSGKVPRGDLLALQMLAASYQGMGALQRERGQLQEAEGSFAEAVKRRNAISHIAASADADSIDLASALTSLSEAQLALDKRADAGNTLKDAQTQLKSVRANTPEFLVARARVDLLSNRLGETDRVRTTMLDRAMDMLREAVAAGYRDFEIDLMRTDPVLDPLRERPDFRMLMMDLAFPADPWAETR